MVSNLSREKGVKTLGGEVDNLFTWIEKVRLGRGTGLY